VNAGLWWWALPVLLLPLLWHRRKRERTEAAPLATARFLPRAEPLQRRVWRWDDPLLLLLRCLLLAALVAFLADPVLAWRTSSVLVVPGSDPASVEREVRAAGFVEAPRLLLPGRDAAAWIHAHEREFAADARLLVVGDVAMPAARPRFRHEVILRSAPAAARPVERHVAVFGPRADDWRRLFGALDGPVRAVVDARPDARTELIVWDAPEAPPPSLRAPLWWVTDGSAFPELARAPQVDGIAYADSARGRLWHGAAWPPRDAAAARALVAAWHDLHLGVQPFTAPAQVLAPAAAAPVGTAGGALRAQLALLLLVLFVLERSVTHVRRR